MIADREEMVGAGNLAMSLLEDGYAILRNALPRATIEALDADLTPAFEETPFGEGSFYGTRTKRFGRLPARSPLAEQLVLHREIRAAAEALLLPFCDVIQLNVAQAMAVHPGAL